MVSRLRNYLNDHHSIEDFFLHNGENPFTKAARKLWQEKDVETRREINKDLGWEKRYEMFH